MRLRLANTPAAGAWMRAPATWLCCLVATPVPVGSVESDVVVPGGTHDSASPAVAETVVACSEVMSRLGSEPGLLPAVNDGVDRVDDRARGRPGR